MKETGIIMSGNHPKLVLDGSKTQTRRVIKPQPIIAYWAGALPQFRCTGFGKKLYSPGYDRHTLLQFCPYGQVGDRLWVRETFSDWLFKESNSMSADFIYKANNTPIPDTYRWKPSIHMPRWASRITLEITGVRVERVQEITWRDCQKEGIRYLIYPKESRTYEGEFERLWGSLNAKRGYGWEVNPWVWVISFTHLP